MDRKMIAPRHAACLALAGALALAACQKPAPPAANTAAAANAAPSNTATSAAASNALPAVADAADAADAKSFLDGLYAHYTSNKNNDFNMFDAKSHVFDKDTQALLAEDNRLLKGDLGTIAGDWLCGCQDFVSLKTTVTILAATPTTAKATSDYVDTGIPSDGTRHDSFDLVKENGDWRIHDVTTGTDPSLRKDLQDEINELKNGSKKPDSGD
jgi:hypothetical protein